MRVEELLLIGFETVRACVPSLHSHPWFALPREQLLLEKNLLLLRLRHALLVVLSELVQLGHSLLLEDVPVQ